MMNRVVGYEAFNNMKDCFGNEYQVGETYETSGPIKFKENGFHFCTHISDVFRYCDGFDENTVVCEVIGSGDLHRYDDEIYDYLDMYSSSKFEVSKILSREEIVATAMSDGTISVLRLIAGYKLNDEEIALILSRFNEDAVRKYIDYYQKNNKAAFQRKRNV